MAVAVEIINPELWGYLLGVHGQQPDSRTQEINQAIFDAFETGFEAFAEFRESLEPQGFAAVRKYLASMSDPDHPSTDVVILIAENLLHPGTNHQARNPRDRYDIPGDMVADEYTFHPNVAAQLRLRAWRRDPNHQGGPPWHGDVRIRYGLIPSLFVTTEEDRRGFKFTNLSFPVNREDPSITAGQIGLALKVAKSLILAGFQGPHLSLSFELR